jgi:hypothetical protein
MPLLFTPGEWTSQPDFAVGIDRGNPLGERARFALIGGESPVEMCRIISPTGTIGSTTIGPGGKAYVLPSTSTTYTANIPDLDPKGGSMTIGWYGLLRDDVVQNLLQSYNGYGWSFYTSSWSPGSLRLGLSPYWGGGGTSTSAFGVTDNTVHAAMVVYDASAATAEFFLDGISMGSGAWGPDPGAIFSPQTFYMNGDASKPAAMLTVQGFAGAFNASQVKSWSENPWQIFEADDEAIWVPGAGAPATFNPSWARNSNAILTGAIR